MHNLTGKLWIKFLKFIKTRWACFFSLIFIWIIPIIMLNEKVALTKVTSGYKITFMGALVLLIVFLKFRKQIYAWIDKKPPGLLRGSLMCIDKILTYGLLLGVIWTISHFINILYDWWILCGLSWIFGLIFLLIDEYLIAKKEGAANERN